MSMTSIEALMQAGCTRHESMLYVALCREGQLTGYEASKVTGIPRSNAYLGLAGLAEKGGANKIDGDTAKYSPVEPKELIQNLKRHFNKVLKVIEQEIPQVKSTGDSFITINGNTQIINKMKNLINNSEKRIYLSASREQLEYVKAELFEAKQRGLKVVVITSDCSNLDGFTCYLADKQPGSIRLITDTAHVLTGQLYDINASTCLYSSNPNMVELIRDSLTNEIKLINIQNGGK